MQEVFKIIKIIFFSVSLIIIPTFLGCVQQTHYVSPQDAINQINEEHKLIINRETDLNKYLNEQDENFCLDNYLVNDIPQVLFNETVLSFEKAQEDITVLFKALQGYYGLYKYLGGDEVFNKAKENILIECENVGSITVGELEKSIRKNLSFIKDAHFMVNSPLNEMSVVPFFYREIAFKKTSNGYETLDGRIVKTVEGYNDLDDLFRRSLTLNGDVVYYPVVFEYMPIINNIGKPKAYDKKILINYINGDMSSLSAQAYDFAPEGDAERFEIYQNDDIPVLKMNKVSWENGNNTFIETATKLRDVPFSVLDLRSNSGGNIDAAEDWMRIYADGNSVKGHNSYVNQVLHTIQREAYSQEFVENGETLFILASKYSNSSSEYIIDMAHNLKNAVIVGENTLGCFSCGDNERRIMLPNSKIKINFTTIFIQHPNGYFEELRGIEPDFYVPAKEAEQAAIAFAKKLY